MFLFLFRGFLWISYMRLLPLSRGWRMVYVGTLINLLIFFFFFTVIPI